MTRMQESEMRGIDLSFERLQVVALALDEAHPDLVFGKTENLERRELWRLGARAHVHPDDAGPLHDLIGFRFDLFLEAGRRQARHVEAIARNVELPSVALLIRSPLAARKPQDTRMVPLRLLCRNAGFRNDVAPLYDLGRHEPRQFLRCGRRRLGAEFAELVAHSGISNCGSKLLVQP